HGPMKRKTPARRGAGNASSLGGSDIAGYDGVTCGSGAPRRPSSLWSMLVTITEYPADSITEIPQF
ncbi:MAG: hypothetical protein M3Y04_04505, partial [Actinomycetota bacterium]|nr:hypothetical protein [Actinomycetota bacterium]